MNIFKRVYCRAFQFAFRAAMPLLPYREPEILNSTDEIPKLLNSKGIKSVLLVTDGFLRKSLITQRLEMALEESGIACNVYDGTNPNPTVDNINAAKDLYIKSNCKAIIAFGGGSSMDCGKAVGALIAYPKKSIDKLKGLLKVRRRLPTLIAVPTTAGTGSEVTVTAVITDRVTKHKYTMNSFPLIPHYAVLDPEVTFSLPKHITSTTGMDALTHAVEAYIGGSTTKETRRLAKETVKLVFENIETAYNEPENRIARENMLHAAYKAGIAFSKSYVGYIHAIAHSLGGQYNVPHGLANTVLMPYVLEGYGKCVYKKLHELGVTAGAASENDSHEPGAKKFIAAIKELNKRMNIQDKIGCIDPKDIPVMARHADKEANPLYPVPRLMNAKELEQFYYAVGERYGQNI